MAGKNILVLGDFMLDEYIFGDVERISPEAPVPVVHARRTRQTAGGAANVVQNIQALGGRCFLAGVIGADEAGRQLINMFARDWEIPPENTLLWEVAGRPTITKTRIIAGNQQVCRVDREELTDIGSDWTRALREFLEKRATEIDAIILSDYGKGALNREILEMVNSLFGPAGKRPTIIALDPHIRNYPHYHDITVLTPNHLEAASFVGFSMETPEELNRGGKKILADLNADHLLVTRGKDGMTLFERDGATRDFPTVARQVFDVTGAGDTVISVYCLALAAGLPREECCRLANRAGGIVVGKLGAATVSPGELFEVSA